MSVSRKCCDCKMQNTKGQKSTTEYIYSEDSKNGNRRNYKWKYFHIAFRGAFSFTQK